MCPARSLQFPSFMTILILIIATALSTSGHRSLVSYLDLSKPSIREQSTKKMENHQSAHKLYWDDQELGVWHCEMDLSIDDLAASYAMGEHTPAVHPFNFTLHVFLRYMYQQGDDKIIIKGILVADVPETTVAVYAGKHHQLSEGDLPPLQRKIRRDRRTDMHDREILEQSSEEGMRTYRTEEDGSRGKSSGYRIKPLELDPVLVLHPVNTLSASEDLIKPADAAEPGRGEAGEGSASTLQALNLPEPWPLKAMIKLPSGPIKIAARATTASASIVAARAIAETHHEYVLTALGGGGGRTCYLRPMLQAVSHGGIANQWDERGANADGLWAAAEERDGSVATKTEVSIESLNSNASGKAWEHSTHQERGHSITGGAYGEWRSAPGEGSVRQDEVRVDGRPVWTADGKVAGAGAGVGAFSRRQEAGTAGKQQGGGMMSEAVVVVAPLWNIREHIIALLDWHIQHYAMLGFTRYMLYLRPGDVAPLLAMPRVLKWAEQGMLRIVQWSAVPEHEGLPYWDQEVIYNHAVLAHIGRPTFLAMIDLDEYLVSLRPGLSTVFDMLRECALGASGALANVQLPRYHVIAGELGHTSRHDRSNMTSVELPLWLASNDNLHPLTKYPLINLKFPPSVKTLVNPNLIDQFYIHGARSYKPHSILRPDPGCMLLAHLKNLYAPRETDSERISTRFLRDASWAAALVRLQNQRWKWLALAPE